MKSYDSRPQLNKIISKKWCYFIAIILIFLNIVTGLFIKWRLYINSIPDKKYTLKTHLILKS